MRYLRVNKVEFLRNLILSGILTEYNPYHDRIGRFTTSGGAATTVPYKKGQQGVTPGKEKVSKVEKGKAPAVEKEGLVSEKEAALIRKNVDQLSEKPTAKQLDAALEKTYKDLGYGDGAKDALENYKSEMNYWVMDGVAGGSSAMMGTIANKTFGQPDSHNFSPGQQRYAASLARTGGVSNDEVRRHAIAQSFTQTFVEKHYGKEVTLYRGVVGDYADTLRGKSSAKVGMYGLSSWTTDKRVASRYAKDVTAGKKGVVLKATVPTSQLFSHHATNSVFKEYKYKEVVLYSKTGSLSVSVE